MKFEEGNIYFNKVYIIQSLSDSDRKTGQELFDDIVSRRARFARNLEAQLINVDDDSELILALDEINNGISKGLFPFIHFETHGFERGIILKSGSHILWEQIMSLIRQMNVRTKNNVYISVAACKGGSIQFSVNITEPSPFRGFIGPVDNVLEGDVLNSYNNFFDVLLLTNDFDKAIDALNATAQLTKYHYMSTESFFQAVIEVYKQKDAQDPSGLLERVENVADGLLKKHPNVISKFNSREEFINSVRSFIVRDTPEVLEILKRRFYHLE